MSQYITKINFPVFDINIIGMTLDGKLIRISGTNPKRKKHNNLRSKKNIRKVNL